MPAPTLVVGAPCWIDLYSSDTEKANEFYGGLFGWTTETARGGVRQLLHVPEGRQARRRLHGELRRGGSPDSWTVYLATDDVERTARNAIAKGGQVHMAPMQVAENGWFTIIGDPGGPASARGRRTR